jgi:hypothetical protein
MAQAQACYNATKGIHDCAPASCILFRLLIRQNRLYLQGTACQSQKQVTGKGAAVTCQQGSLEDGSQGAICCGAPGVALTKDGLHQLHCPACRCLCSLIVLLLVLTNRPHKNCLKSLDQKSYALILLFIFCKACSPNCVSRDRCADARRLGALRAIQARLIGRSEVIGWSEVIGLQRTHLKRSQLDRALGS